MISRIAQPLTQTATTVLILLGLVGCHAIEHPYSNVPGPCAPVYPCQPKEQQKLSLPDYTIEPPDVLTIEAINLIPRPPYRLRPLDNLLVETKGLPDDSPPAREIPVGIDGTLVLGFGYDSADGKYAPISVVGLTLPEAQARIADRLATVAADPEVWISLISIANQQNVAGEHLVAPDGTVNLGTYGRVRVVGMTIEEAKLAIESHLSERFLDPEVAVDVFGYNSKSYYIITQGAGLGDQVVHLPVTGNETALDAISQIQGLSGTSSTRMWIARPGANEDGGDQIMPIDWLGITQRGDVTTNYQMLPGDRLYISEDKLIALDTALAKIISPVERVFGVTLLGTQTAKQIKFFDQFNNNGGGL